MKQRAFEQRFSPEWELLGAILARLEVGATHPDQRSLPERTRAVCQHLALARQRGYSLALSERLNELATRGHVQLYGARPAPWARLSRLVVLDFPRKVRAEWRLMALSSALFYGPLLFALLLCATEPEHVYLSVDPAQVAMMEWMYDPDALHQQEERAAQGDVAMFGFYIYNNVGIALRTFGAGLALGLGAALILVYNGVTLGSVAGYLTAIGYGDTFWSFVSGHSGFELTAIVVAGGAGLKLGLSVVAPGRRSRARALREEAHDALPLVAGFSAMLVVAAIIEAFWSSSRLIPSEVKIPVGLALWLVVLAWLGLTGARR